MLLGDAKNLFAQRRRKLARGVAEKFCAEMRRRTGDAGEGDVDAVGGSARHKAENEHGFRCHRLQKDLNTEDTENTERTRNDGDKE